jgi:hypothetical protein
MIREKKLRMILRYSIWELDKKVQHVDKNADDTCDH